MSKKKLGILLILIPIIGFVLLFLAFAAINYSAASEVQSVSESDSKSPINSLLFILGAVLFVCLPAFVIVGIILIIRDKNKSNIQNNQLGIQTQNYKSSLSQQKDS